MNAFNLDLSGWDFSFSDIKTIHGEDMCAIKKIKPGDWDLSNIVGIWEKDMNKREEWFDNISDDIWKKLEKDMSAGEPKEFIDDVFKGLWGEFPETEKLKKEINELKESNAIIRDSKTTLKWSNSKMREQIGEKDEQIEMITKANSIQHNLLIKYEEENKKLGKQIDLLRDNVQELVKSNIELSNYWKQEYNRSIALDAELMRITRANKQYINNFEKLIRKQEKEIEEFKGYKESVRTYTRQLEETAAFWIKKYWNNR